PVSHVGKIYNLLSYKIADEVYKKVNGLDDVYIWLVSQIGRRIDQPMIASAEVILKDNTILKEVEKGVIEVI
ncbi:MAG: S-adenosylmethionine synthetase, partial [Nitrososphaeria archaeon]|nr:S-adenosylmethionine synthetase [Nitrososphaeria archaeon]